MWTRLPATTHLSNALALAQVFAKTELRLTLHPLVPDEWEENDDDDPGADNLPMSAQAQVDVAQKTEMNAADKFALLTQSLGAASEFDTLKASRPRDVSHQRHSFVAEIAALSLGFRRVP